MEDYLGISWQTVMNEAKMSILGLKRLTIMFFGSMETWKRYLTLALRGSLHIQPSVLHEIWVVVASAMHDTTFVHPEVIASKVLGIA